MNSNYGVHKAVEKSPCGRFVRYDDMLGGGAHKDVYLGFDNVRRIEVAWSQIVFYEKNENMFSEAILLTSLDHERIMKCYSYWFDPDSRTLNMITELFQLGSLKRYTNDGAVVDFGTIKNWGRQILEGLTFLHSHNPKIIHRDIKCDNVFVCDVGKQVSLGDLGLAIRLSDGDFAKDVQGTPQFMAPEYYDEEYNELVDIYAFGMCLLELATGEYPYGECDNPCQIFRKVTTGVKPASLEKVRDARVRDIIQKCLLPVSLRPSAQDLLKDPFFLKNKSGSTFEACAPASSFVISHPLRGLYSCARDMKNLYLF